MSYQGSALRPGIRQDNPSLLRKFFRLNWALILLVSAIAGIGFMMLYSVAGGSMDPWARPQLNRFAVGMAIMLIVGLIALPAPRSAARSSARPSASATSSTPSAPTIRTTTKTTRHPSRAASTASSCSTTVRAGGS